MKRREVNRWARLRGCVAPHGESSAIGSAVSWCSRQRLARPVGGPLRSFREDLGEAGYVEGKNVALAP